MAARDDRSEVSGIRELMAMAVRIAADQGDMSEAELTAVLSQALRDPFSEQRLKALLAKDGVSPEYQREYLRIFAEWRRAELFQRKASS